MFRKLIAVCAVAALTGCAFNAGETTGNQKLEKATQESLTQQFVPDVATRDEVALQFGPPDRKVSAGTMEIWTYSYRSSAHLVVAVVAVQTGEKKHADFYFDEKTGILKKIELESHRG
ncbi:hypothetical protein [Paraburkholderia rhizosphaerae]|uniref:Beta-barrel assembly machine subunit BamE n=1 Tax=Paraburkholderia rhizosphaerae TaxID=480658 RepID=A0A4R8LY17_9BURK|nr:hypothetical protein [Paraburkholderia rhizosphaerae]TDY51685.1 hypothetical protein BX592_107253 [Paraburkholderia rhizosphaerae]